MTTRTPINGTSTAPQDITPIIAGTSNAALGTTVTVPIARQTVPTLLQAHGGWNTTPLSQESVGRLHAALRARDFRINADTLSRTVSAEIAGFPGLDLSAAEAQIESDLTTGRAKKAGKHGAPPSLPGLEGRIKLGDRIRDALDGDRLQLLCEPVVCLKTGSIVRWQVLVRLVPTQGWHLPPASFVAAAERFGLAERLDTSVISRAVELLGRQQSTDPKLQLAVSVSAKSLSSPAFVDRQEVAIAASGVSPQNLIFGIPASEAESAARFSERVSSLGCRVSLENFGTGPGPLSGLISLRGSATRLAALPLASVNLDPRLVRHLTADVSNRALVEGIAELATGLGIKSVATSVSNEATVELLRECGIDYGVGRHLGMPLPMIEL